MVSGTQTTYGKLVLFTNETEYVHRLVTKITAAFVTKGPAYSIVYNYNNHYRFPVFLLFDYIFLNLSVRFSA